MGKKNSKILQTEKELESRGVRFTKANNKSLRMYFQSQFTAEFEDEDFPYLNHIFELKVFLYFRCHYNKSHLLNINKFLEDTFEKNIETIFRDIRDIEIIQSYEPDPKIFDYIEFERKITKNHSQNICTVNSLDRYMQIKEIESSFEITEDVIRDLKDTSELNIHILMNTHTDIIYFVLLKLFNFDDSENEKNLKKLIIHQSGLKVMDELMYTVIAQFVKKNPQIESVCFLEESYEKEYDEKLENNIINRQHIFLFYQVLSKKTDLIELRIFLFLKDYNLILLSHVLDNNKNLRKLQVRNVYWKESDAKELDFSYSEMIYLGENVRDEIFIFFNYLAQLNCLEELQLTHFRFNSEINFLACEAVKNLKNIKNLSLFKNQAIIGNDAAALEYYHFAKSNLEKLDMGSSYYNMIRRFDFIINTEKLLEVNIGVLDFISFSAFTKFLEKTNLERVRLTLNKPCVIDSIPMVFNQITDYPLRAKNLKYFYVYNVYTDHTYANRSNNRLEVYLDKLKRKLIDNKLLRKLSFIKGGKPKHVIEIKDGKDCDKRTFRYIGKKDFIRCINLVMIMKELFNYKEYEKRFKFRLQTDLFFLHIFKRIVQFTYAQYRTIIVGREFDDN